MLSIDLHSRLHMNPLLFLVKDGFDFHTDFVQEKLGIYCTKLNEKRITNQRNWKNSLQTDKLYVRKRAYK